MTTTSPKAVHAATVDRRRLLLGGSALATLAACGKAGDGGRAGVSADPSLVSSPAGKFRGVVVDGVLEVRGVRYAEPPVGALRFQAPKKPGPAVGEIDATIYGQAAVQMRSGAGAAAYPGEVGEAMAEAFAPPAGLKPEGDEDCLVLNVYTPKADGAKRPVMVWLHGGGFSYGQAALNIYRGHNLAKRHDVVAVGINHRLNIFGFLPLDTLGVPGFQGSANAGMLDIVMALEWVRDNIAAFGGDPGNVTIFGQSGGGAKVSILLAMPQAKGLFHKAIIESGAGLKVQEREDAEFTATDFLTRLGIPASIAAQQLATVPVSDILQIAAEMGAGKFRPSIDGKAIPRHPFTPDAPAEAAAIPVMIGFTKDEQTLYNVGKPDWSKTTEAQLLAAADKAMPKHGKELVAAFKTAFPDYDAPHLLMQVTGTVNALRSHHTLASRKAAQAAPVYAYVFAHDLPPMGGVLKAPHTAEIPYIMDNVELAPKFAGAADADQALGKLMSAIWVNFARTGDPNVPGLPKWPKFDAATRPTMFLDTSPKVVEQPFPEVWKLIQENPVANASAL